MIKNIFLVGTGGFIGSVARYLLSKGLIHCHASAFPLGTLSVNIIGCFIIGALYALAAKGEIFNPSWQVFLMIGICGGFTTFSSFALENLILLRNHDYGMFLLNTIGSVTLGIFATFLGFLLMQKTA